MKQIALLLLMLVFASGAVGESSEALRARTFNLDSNGLALKGYDPVSYHQARPQEGKAEFSASYNGVRYRFASQANLDAFQANPASYTPAYGGWCAWAMLEGEQVDINPDTFKIINGRTYVFYNGFFGDTLKKWDAQVQKEPESALLQKADNHWVKIGGE